MSNLEKWIKAILNEDADRLSIGSVRTLQMIKHEFESLQKENQDLKQCMDEIINLYPDKEENAMISLNNIREIAKSILLQTF